MRLSLIAAVGFNKEIGYQGSIPWTIPSDLKHFRGLTTGHTVLMGRKTYESIGRPLPRRTNIVISGRHDFSPAGCQVADSVAAGLKLASPEETELFIIGGAGIYAIALSHVTRMYITHVEYSGPADVYFPEVNPSNWEVTSAADPISSPTDQYKFRFIIYDRRSNIHL